MSKPETPSDGGLARLAGETGRQAIALTAYVGQLGYLAAEAAYWKTLGVWVDGKPLGRARIAARLIETGPRTVPVVSLIIFLTGMVLAMQLAYQLRRFGVESLTPGAVAVTICREIGPLLTAVVVSARVGASITAEIGTMVVNEEVLALRVMSINPVRYLVVPRLLAMMVMVPCLTILANYVGMAGGLLVSVLFLDMSAGQYIRLSVDALETLDLIAGLAKSVAFGFQIGLVACLEGLRVEGGAAGVGKATTRSVVVSIVCIIIIDLVFTQLFFAA